MSGNRPYGKASKRRRKRRGPYRGPVVAESLINDYLDRKLDSFAWIKNLGHKELCGGLNGFAIDGGIDPETGAPFKAFTHQLACFNIGIDLPHFMFLLDMGGGKTRLACDLIRWRMKYSGCRSSLVLVPKEVNVWGWIDEIKLHAPSLRVVALIGANRRELIEEPADVYLLNYPGLQMFMSTLQRQGKSKRRKRVIDDALAKDFITRFDAVFFDECHHIGSTTSLLYQECRWLTKHCRFRYGLTGTPFGRDPMKLWPQFHVVDDGETFGNSLGLFRAAFFNARETPWAIEYDFDKGKESRLRHMMEHRSIYYGADEYKDQPEKPIYIKVPLQFGKDALEQYNTMKHRIRESRGAIEELQNVFLRMRMITSGFISVKSVINPNSRLTLQFDSNYKLDALEELLLDMPEASKAVVYHDYVFTGSMIGERLKGLGFNYSRLDGAVKNPGQELSRFVNDRGVRVLVANSASGATGLNLQVANYMVFYESPVSPITRQQAERRLWRSGQKRRVYIYDLVVKRSVDEKILEYLKEGRDLFEAICKGGRKAAVALS